MKADQALSGAPLATTTESPRRDAPVTSSREALYQQHFVAQVQMPAPTHFIRQVDGFGVQVFAQTSCFAAR